LPDAFEEGIFSLPSRFELLESEAKTRCFLPTLRNRNAPSGVSPFSHRGGTANDEFAGLFLRDWGARPIPEAGCSASKTFASFRILPLREFAVVVPDLSVCAVPFAGHYSLEV